MTRIYKRTITSRSAFSLTEMVVVLAIIGVLSAIALPRFGSSLTRVRLDNAARRIVRDVELAQRTARARSISVNMVFNQAAERYRIVGLPSLESSQRVYRVDLEVEYDGVVINTANFGGSNSFTFDGYGVPNNGGSITISLAGQTQIIFVNPETGIAELL